MIQKESGSMRIGRYCQILFLVRHSGRLITRELSNLYLQRITPITILRINSGTQDWNMETIWEVIPLVLVEDDCDLSYSSRWKEMVRFNFEDEF